MTATAVEPSRSSENRPRWVYPAALVGSTVAAVSLVRVLTDSPDLTSSGTIEASLRLGTPILLAALGGIFSERSGIVNIGLEGMLIMGTWGAGWGGWHWGPWAGVACAIAFGTLGGLLHALATVTFGVDQIISGVAINILGAGTARFLSVVAYDDLAEGGATQSPPVTGDVGSFSFPFLAGGPILGFETPDLLGDLEDRGWFFISDVAGILRGLTGDLSLLVLIALLLVPITSIVLFRTRFGLRLRSCGEQPVAADSLGVNVYLYRYIGVSLSGALAGFGGAVLVLESASVYREGQTQGKGFIALAAVIFGNWRPFGSAAAALLFGWADALRLRDQEAVHALLLIVAIALLALTFRQLIRKRTTSAAWMFLGAVIVFIWWLSSESIPRDFTSVTPYVATLLVLSFGGSRLRPPQAEGVPYRKGESG